MALRQIRSTPVITAGAYGAKDAAGGLNTLDKVARNGGGGEIQSIHVIDKDSESENLKIWIFTAEVTAVADNAPIDFSDSDLALYLVGVVDIPAADYVQIADNGVASTNNLRLGFKLPAGSHKLYYQIELPGTPTFTAVDDLTLIFTIDSE